MSPMTTRTATTDLFTDLAAESGQAPDWVQLLPAGPEIVARDGRRWTFEPQTILNAFTANRGPLVIDYEHGQDHLATAGVKAPAAGWITAMEARDGAIWGKVEWTATAAREIVERAYRFLSPSMRHTKNGVLTRLQGAGLVNRPALEMTALSREEHSHQKEPLMTLKAIATALGLADSAGEAAVLAAIAGRDTERETLCSALAIDVASDTAALTTAVTTLVNDHKTALARAEDTSELETLRTSLASIQADRLTEKIEKALDDAQAAGKITPASRGDYLAMCQVEGGLGRFESLVKTLPVIGEPSGIGNTSPATDDAAEPDSVALAAAARKYQDEQAALGIHISTAQAVLHVRDTK
ncbi:MAG: hypothetical protein KIS86_04685 [Devosia sp.]|nr:hypothetical protein [Devosia sp.]